MSIRSNGGYRGARNQLGFIGTIVGIGWALYSASQQKKQQKAQQQMQQQAIAASDPYAKYRDQAAQQLNALVADPSSITNTAEYKARQVAAARMLASEGYTNSGNAVIGAADAASSSYQQAFNNLAILSGATATPGAGYNGAMQANNTSNQQYNQGMNQVYGQLGSAYKSFAAGSGSSSSYTPGYGTDFGMGGSTSPSAYSGYPG